MKQLTIILAAAALLSSCTEDSKPTHVYTLDGVDWIGYTTTAVFDPEVNVVTRFQICDKSEVLQFETFDRVTTYLTSGTVEGRLITVYDYDYWYSVVGTEYNLTLIDCK